MLRGIARIDVAGRGAEALAVSGARLLHELLPRFAQAVVRAFVDVPAHPAANVHPRRQLSELDVAVREPVVLGMQLVALARHGRCLPSPTLAESAQAPGVSSTSRCFSASSSRAAPWYSASSR